MQQSLDRARGRARETAAATEQLAIATCSAMEVLKNEAPEHCDICNRDVNGPQQMTAHRKGRRQTPWSFSSSFKLLGSIFRTLEFLRGKFLVTTNSSQHGHG
jgi:hypothetical protein